MLVTEPSKPPTFNPITYGTSHSRGRFIKTWYLSKSFHSRCGVAYYDGEYHLPAFRVNSRAHSAYIKDFYFKHCLMGCKVATH